MLFNLEKYSVMHMGNRNQELFVVPLSQATRLLNHFKPLVMLFVYAVMVTLPAFNHSANCDLLNVGIDFSSAQSLLIETNK